MAAKRERVSSISFFFFVLFSRSVWGWESGTASRVLVYETLLLFLFFLLDFKQSIQE